MGTSWVDIAGPVERLSAELDRALLSLEPLRLAWEEAAAGNRDLFAEARKRTLRQHAIETGIIERLYDVDWGTTEALVAEGITLEVAEREGGLDGDALATIQAQYDALEFVAQAATGAEPMSSHFIRQLHQLITKNQHFYDATDALGRPARPPLLRGEWKREANHVTRPDGSLLLYCPPERVQDQMDMLVRAYSEASHLHPIHRAAWLHHAFIRVHPFQDGNGRVARALVLLELLRAHYAPIVVDRGRREDYIQRLDKANDGDLEPLIELFAELERRAMVQQFQAPIQVSIGAGVLGVARAAAAKLADLQQAAVAQRKQRFADVAVRVQDSVIAYLEDLRPGLEETFRVNDPAASVRVNSCPAGQERSHYWRGQIIRLANSHDFYANLAEGSWWSTLTLSMLNERMRFMVAIVKVGAGETGVGTVLIAAERLYRDGDADTRETYEWLFDPRPTDQVPFTIEQDGEELRDKVADLLNAGLSAAIAEHVRHLG